MSLPRGRPADVTGVRHGHDRSSRGVQHKKRGPTELPCQNDRTKPENSRIRESVVMSKMSVRTPAAAPGWKSAAARKARIFRYTQQRRPGCRRS